METRQDDMKLMLAGIASERTAIQARLTYLDTRERELREAGVLGSAADSKRLGRSKAKVKEGKKTTSPAARQKIAAAQKARWARVRAEKAASAAKVSEAPPAYEPQTATA